MNRIDAYSASRNLIDSAFNHMTWYEEICKQSGFKGISQIWKEEPAWYFWLDHVKGAFLLRLHADESLGENHYLSFSLHYFPREEELAYQSLTSVEKQFLTDDKLIHGETNTPHFEAYEQCLNVFMIAEIGCVVDSACRLKTLLYSTTKDEHHPVNRFVDLLVTALNFKSKQHHLQSYILQDGDYKTLFLSYSESSFHRFLTAFELETSLKETVIPNARMKLWRHAAHSDAVCSASGTCNCSH